MNFMAAFKSKTASPKLGAVRPDDMDFHDKLKQEHEEVAGLLKELVEHHAKEKESAVRSDMRKKFSADDRIAMNRAFEAAKKKVKVV